MLLLASVSITGLYPPRPVGYNIKGVAAVIKELKKFVLGLTRNTDYTLPFGKGMLLRVGRYQYQVFDTISTGKKAKIAISGCLKIVRSCLPLGRKVLLLRVGGYPYKVRDIITGEMPTISILASGIGCFDIV